MPETSSPATYESLGGRPFAFYPAIRNIEHNEWTCVRETWSEVLVANAKTGAEVWIARNFLGPVSSTDQPVAILGLSRELEYKAGSVWPYNPPVLEMPAPPRVSPGTPRAAPVDAPPTGPAPPSTESQMGRLILYAVLVGFGFCLLAVLVARQGMPNPRDWLRRRDIATSDQQYLSLTREDDRHAILRKLGPPEREQWITPEPAEIQFELFWYPQRSYIIVLMGSDRNGARYIGALHATSRAILDTVPLPGGGSTAAMLRTLPKF